MKKRILTLMLASTMLAGVLSGCGKGEEASIDGKKVSLGYYNCDHMIGAAVGEAAGIFEEMGLDVTLTGNGKVPEAMSAGHMDVGYIGTRGLTAANGEGAPVVIGATNHIGGSMYLVVANDIEKPEDLYGQKVAFGDLSKSEAWVAGYADELKLSSDPSKYDNVTMSSDADKYAALKAGQIKAFTCCDPWGSMAEHEGVGKIMSTYMEMDGEMGVCCSFALSKKFAEENPELAKKMLVAHQKSIEYVYTHPLKAAQIFAEYYKVPEEVALMTIYKKCVEEGRTLTWEIDEESFKHAYGVYEKYKLIEKLPEFDQLIARDIYEGANLSDFDEFIKSEVEDSFPIGMSYEDFEKKAMEIDG